MKKDKLLTYCFPLLVLLFNTFNKEKDTDLGTKVE